tara:strand:+ start:87 stop:752 length:666 start_codon:yes stop_codon:yes gene_type:complete
MNKVLYAHYRKTDNTIFYVGIGKPYRPYSKNRGKHWHNIVKNDGYEIKVLQENLTTERAEELEILTIAFYGRKDLGLGPLINLTDGGEKNFGGMKGKKHYCYDESIWKFQKDDIIEEMTQFDFRTKYNLRHSEIHKITKGKGHSCDGWICLNPTKVFQPKLKPKYVFEHKDGTKVTCTCSELMKKYGLQKVRTGIYGISKGVLKSSKGWKCLNPDRLNNMY